MSLTPEPDDLGAPVDVVRSIVVTPEPLTAVAATIDLVFGDDAGATDALAHGSFGSPGTTIALVFGDDAGATDSSGAGGVTGMVRPVAHVDDAGAGDTAAVDVLSAFDPDTGLLIHTDTAGATDTAVITIDRPAGITITAGPARIIMTTPPAVTVVADVDPVAPTGGIVLPTARPVFTVAVDTDDTAAAVEVEYGPAAGGGPAVIVATAAAAGLTDAQVTVAATTDLDPGVYTWRARIVGPYGAGAWTDPVTFAVNPLEGQAVAAGGHTVTPGAVPPVHIWHLDPTSDAAPGGTARIVGTGFGSAATVLLGALVCPDPVVTTHPPVGSTTDRTITPGGPTTWHQVVGFTIPDVDPDHPGDAVTVHPEVR